MLREERGESLRKLARRANISVSQLNRIERLQSSPAEATILKLAEALDVKPWNLFGEE